LRRRHTPQRDVLTDEQARAHYLGTAYTPTELPPALRDASNMDSLPILSDHALNRAPAAAAAAAR
jgi:hypothetical protein